MLTKLEHSQIKPDPLNYDAAWFKVLLVGSGELQKSCNRWFNCAYGR